MRKEFDKSVLVVSFLLIFSSGCSLFKRSPKATSKSETSGTVSREKYDRLLAQYNQLLKRQDGNKKSLNMTTVDEEKSIQKHKSMESFEDMDHVISGEISKMSDGMAYQKLEDQTDKLFTIKKLMDQKRYGQAMKMLQELENTGFKQIKVRTKYMIGEILLQQKEYDLAMQVYEEIVKEMAFSGLVLKAIQKLVICTRELDLEDKNKQYSSLLNKLFGNMSL